jgi:hypothetical protein
MTYTLWNYENYTSGNRGHAKIPLIVHFIVEPSGRNNSNLKYSSSNPFSFINYVIFLAARRHIRPKKLFVHYYQEPNTFWWNYTKHDLEINITLIKSRLVKSIYNKPVDHHAHQADIIRLEVLLKYGGICLDTDVLVLRSFDPLLYINDVVMGQQDDSKAVCNAVLLSKKESKFLQRLHDSYQSFNQNCWDCHSVLVAGYLASIYPFEITVLPTKAFFRPSWHEEKALFKSNNYDFTENYACHLWNKVNNKKYLSQLTPTIALTADTTFARILRHAIGNETFLKLNKTYMMHIKDIRD